MIQLNPKRDPGMLYFIWRWKIATSATLAYLFFPNQKPDTAYRRLQQLKRGRYLTLRVGGEGHEYFWSLGRKGFAAIEKYLPLLRSTGFQSENLEHDQLVNLLHLGEWQKGIPKGISRFTEQELRRVDPLAYPDWVPNSDLHRSDGYIRLSNNTSSEVISIEVERSFKTVSQYQMIGNFYRDERKVNHILWMVTNRSKAKRLQNYLEGKESPENQIHHFVIQKDLLGNSWGASIQLGPKKGQSIREWFHSYSQNDPLRNLSERSPSTDRFRILDTRKCGFKTRTYSDVQNEQSRPINHGVN